MLDRPGVPQCIMRVRWEHVEEAPVSETFSFNSIPREAGDVASEWTMFYNSIAEGTTTTCGCKVVDASLGSNPRTRSQTPERKKTIKQKKEACGTPEPAERYWQASQSRALAVTVGRSGAVLLNWHAGKGGVSLFPWWFQGCPPTIGGSHSSQPPQKSLCQNTGEERWSPLVEPQIHEEHCGFPSWIWRRYLTTSCGEVLEKYGVLARCYGPFSPQP